MRLAMLSLLATALFTAAAAQYNALLNLTNTYYSRTQSHSVYTCAVACINEAGSRPDCDLSSKSCWCSSPDSNLIDYACCFSSCTGTVQDAARNIGDWCSSVVSKPWEPPTCGNVAAQQTTAIPPGKRGYYGSDNQGSLSSGTVTGLVIGLLWGFIMLIMLIGCCSARNSPEPVAAHTAPVLPLHEIRPQGHEQAQLHELAPPRVQTPPPAYSEVPKDT